jgi:hypothetical protein
MNYEPWQHLVIEDFLPKKEFDYHCWRAQKIDIVDNVNRHFLDYDPFPGIQWLKDLRLRSFSRNSMVKG